MAGNPKDISTKQRILESAATLFAEKGFTETTTRELAEALGMNSASLYYHFPSKNAILVHMLEDYSEYNSSMLSNNIPLILQEKPTTDGVLACLRLVFPPDKQEYYIKMLCVMLQEQHRNTIVREFIANNIILNSEKTIRKIVEELKRLGVLHEDTNPDYWMKVHSCLMYSYANRMMLGIGDMSPDFTGMGMSEMVRHNFDMMFERHGTEKAGSPE